MTTFKQVQDKASKLEIIKGNLADRIDDVLDRARINAEDTVYIEKAQDVTKYDHVALDTVSEILSYLDDEEVCDWFAANNVTW